jgi:hypothetical protein
MPIKVAAWNLNHRTGRKPVAHEATRAVTALAVDVLVFTEYVDGEHQDEFKADLKSAGYVSIAVSPQGYGQNQVLMASREPLIDSGLLSVPGYTEAATTNWVHRRVPKLGFEVVGMRVPAYKTRRDQRGYWAQVEAILQSARDRPLLMIGDFNCDPASDEAPGSVVINGLRRLGYGFANPDGRCSYYGPTGAETRIDHAISTPLMRVNKAIYRAGLKQYRFCGTEDAPSDHAVIEVTCSTKS